MPLGCCLILVLLLCGPRLVIAGLFFFTDLLSRAFDSWVWPLVGFLFAPWTTLAFTWATLYNGGIDKPASIFVLILAVIFDLSQVKSVSA